VFKTQSVIVKYDSDETLDTSASAWFHITSTLPKPSNFSSSSAIADPRSTPGHHRTRFCNFFLNKLTNGRENCRRSIFEYYFPEEQRPVRHLRRGLAIILTLLGMVSNCSFFSPQKLLFLSLIMILLLRF
jgi:hypothetical protein